MIVQKYKHEFDDFLYNTREECLEVAAEHIEEEEIWEALREDFSIYAILKAILHSNEEMYLQAYDKAKNRYVDEYFMEVKVEEDEE